MAVRSVTAVELLSGEIELMSEDIRHIVCPHCDSVNRIPSGRDARNAKCGHAHRALFHREAGSSLHEQLRDPNPAQRHPGASRLLGAVVRAMQSDGADLRARLLRIRARRPVVSRWTLKGNRNSPPATASEVFRPWCCFERVLSPGKPPQWTGQTLRAWLRHHVATILVGIQAN